MVEEYHKWKKQKRDQGVNNPLAKIIKLAVVIAVTVTIWLLPTSAFGIEGLTVVEQRIIGVFAFATLMWVLEAIPAWSTSLIVVALLLGALLCVCAIQYATSKPEEGQKSADSAAEMLAVDKEYADETEAE